MTHNYFPYSNILTFFFSFFIPHNISSTHHGSLLFRFGVFFLQEFHYFQTQLFFSPGIIIPSSSSLFSILFVSSEIICVSTSCSGPNSSFALLHIFLIKIVLSSNSFLHSFICWEICWLIYSRPALLQLLIYSYFNPLFILSLVISASQFITFVGVSGSSHSSYFFFKLALHFESFLLLMFLIISFRHISLAICCLPFLLCLVNSCLVFSPGMFLA